MSKKSCEAAESIEDALLGKGMIFHAGIKKRNISVFPT